MTKAKTKSTRARRFTERAWRTDMLARDIYIALIVSASKTHDDHPAPGITWEARCSHAAQEALTAARAFDTTRKATK